MRYCYYCKQELPEESFTNSQRRVHGGREVGRCIPCASIKNREWRIKNVDRRDEHNKKRRENPVRKEYDRQRGYMRKYGITRETYLAMREAQGYRCAICGLHEDEHKLSRWGNLCLDHNHKTGQIRSLLCAQCNKGLGSFKDSAIMLKWAAAYLESHELEKVKGVASK